MQIIKTTIKNGKADIGNQFKLWTAQIKNEKAVYHFKTNYKTAYGFGEKFDSINQKGKLVKAAVIEKCFYQGEFTYLSVPFLMSADGFGIYVNTYTEVCFDLQKEGEIVITVDCGSKGELYDIYVFNGNLKEIISKFKKVTAPTKVFPKWVLGAWMSSNRWRYQSEIEQQLEITMQNEFPHNVMVIEPWSDLSTHYHWGGSVCKQKNGDQFAKYNEIEFPETARFGNPKAMVDKLHDNNIKVLLWVIPIFAIGEAIEGDHNRYQRDIDNQYVVKNKQCALKPDGKPYYIPHTWNIGSMVPDFTSKTATENWLNHFKHLLEIGIDGFKTDGGEFIHDKDVAFSDGTTGIEGRSRYSDLYVKAFNDFCGSDRAVFARAGGAYVAANAITWAGDQESTWKEFNSVIKAGISAGLSGISNWGFDIAGFSGYLPSRALYERSVQASAFVPVMQWHSDPPRNGRCDFSGAWQVNDRSPWNIAQYYKDDQLLQKLKLHFDLHYNLIPYQYALMLEANKTGVPAMRHLAYEFSTDENVYNIEDQFMLGEALLVAPVLTDYITTRNVYLPQGQWFDIYTGKSYVGGKHYDIALTSDYIPAFILKNKCLPVNINGKKLGSFVGNDLSGYVNLTFIVSGSGSYTFTDDLQNQIEIEWTEQDCKVISNAKNIDVQFLRAENDHLF